MNVTASLTLNGTVSYTFAHYVDKDSLDTPRRTAPINTMMMDYENILILKEPKLVTITENIKLRCHLCIYPRTKRFDYATSFFLFSPFPTNIDMFPIPFAQTFKFISPTSILEPAITPTFEQYYPPPILTKHPIWYSLNADFFILLQGILYGLHW